MDYSLTFEDFCTAHSIDNERVLTLKIVQEDSGDSTLECRLLEAIQQVLKEHNAIVWAPWFYEGGETQPNPSKDFGAPWRD